MDDTTAKIREKYLKNGYDSLSDLEKIILILSYSEKESNAEISAVKISEIYGNLHTAADSDTTFLMKECGISLSSAILINLIPALRRKAEMELVSHNRLNTAENAKKYFSAYLIGRRTEYVVASSTDKKFNLKNTAVLAYGGFSEVHFPIRLILDFALKNEAEYIFIAHCHPKDTSVPSASDIKTTKEISCALNSIGKSLADHIIVGTDGAVSLRELDDRLFDKITNYTLSNT
ncbi:MAG: JAB domain-containing protein [Ruminococcus sp.]|nr:JAB domain-containing protein [Ruminococcus sp.]